MRRIVNLCEAVPATAQLVIGTDLEAFARDVTDARNLRTHLDTSRRAKAAHPHRNIVRLQAQLGVILEAAILHRELGFSDTTIAERMSRASRLYRLSKAAAE